MFITHAHIHGVNILTITKVKLSSDLRHAKVFVSFLDKEMTPDGLIARLKSQKSVIRYNLGNQIKSKYVPEINFYYDDTLAYAEHIDELIHKIKDSDH